MIKKRPIYFKILTALLSILEVPLVLFILMLLRARNKAINLKNKIESRRIYK